MQIPSSRQPLTDDGKLANRVWWRFFQQLQQLVSSLPGAKLGSSGGSYTDGELLIGNSLTGDLDKGVLVAGSGVTVANGHGTITVAATGNSGTVMPDGDLLANISGTTALAVAVPFSSLLDHVLGSAEGDILCRGSAGWTALAPGEAGQQLQTAGPAAIPTWASGGALGVSDGSNAAAGFVGEYISSSIAAGSGPALTSATAANVTSISLSAGDWDVWGNAGTAPAAATVVSLLESAIGTVSATLPAQPNGGAFLALPASFAAGAPALSAVGITRISLSAAATLYLIISAAFTGGACSAYGFLGARRVR